MKKANTHDELLENLTTWAKGSSDVKSVIIVGSRARTYFPADEYSDIDIILVVTNPVDFMTSDNWLENIGCYWLMFNERTIAGHKERRVLFENALDIDFVICAEADVRQSIKNNDFDIIMRGYHVSIDKIGLSKILPQTNELQQVYIPPTESAFQNLINDFWYHSVWSAKKLLRGEIWMAKSCLDVYMKNQMLRIIEIHAHAKNGEDYDTWFNGRFFDYWAEQRVKDRVRDTFALYDKEDIVRALQATMELFRMLAIETADMMSFEYSYKADTYASGWVKKSLNI